MSVKKQFSILTNNYVLTLNLALSACLGTLLFLYLLKYDLGISISQKDLVPLYFKLGTVSVACALPVLTFYFFKNRSLTARLNSIVFHALDERKLSQNFPALLNAHKTSIATKNIQDLIVLLRSFDTMKASRIMVDSSSLKMIINQIQEGIIVINREKIVTHINHPAEQLFKLIPGEIVGETISRKISHPDILQKIDLALSQSQKTKEKIVKFQDGTTLELSILPVNNKLGEVMRSLLFIKEKKRKPTPELNQD